MGNILVLGVGPLPFEPVDKLHAPGIRTWQIVSRLASARHFITLCIITFGDFKPGANAAGGGTVREDLGSNIGLIRFRYNPAETVDAIRTLHVATRFSAVVSTSDIMNGLAADLDLDIPMWLDYNGDPFAEKQLQAEQYEHDGSLKPQWELYCKGLVRGDRFSVCSTPQKYALVGQLGFAGRLTRKNSGEELVHVVPNCSRVMTEKVPVRSKPLKGNSIPAGAFLVLWSGGYNTWCDPETLFRGLESAMGQDASIYFATTGGALEGHDTKSYEVFTGLVNQSAYRDRFILLGWVPTEEVGAYYEQADVAVFADRYSVEGELGSRTRIIDWIQYKVPIICTDLCELTRQLSQEKLIWVFPVGDSVELGKRILRGARNPAELDAMAQAALEWFRVHLKEEDAFSPLLEWAKSPGRAGDHLPEIAVSKMSGIHLNAASKQSAPVPGVHGIGQEKGKSSIKDKLKGIFRRN